jgi:hypothetical protein
MSKRFNASTRELNTRKHLLPSWRKAEPEREADHEIQCGHERGKGVFTVNGKQKQCNKKLLAAKLLPLLKSWYHSDHPWQRCTPLSSPSKGPN